MFYFMEVHLKCFGHLALDFYMLIIFLLHVLKIVICFICLKWFYKSVLHCSYDETALLSFISLSLDICHNNIIVNIYVEYL